MMAASFVPLGKLVIGKRMELHTRFRQFRHRMTARRRHFLRVLLRGDLGRELDAFLNIRRQPDR